MLGVGFTLVGGVLDAPCDASEGGDESRIGLTAMQDCVEVERSDVADAARVSEGRVIIMASDDVQIYKTRSSVSRRDG